MSMRKRSSAILTALIYVISVVFFSFSSGAVSIEPKISSGEFRFVSYENGESIKTKYFYSDEFFSHSGKEKNVHLRTFMLDLALTAFGADKGNYNAGFTMELLDKTGFSIKDLMSVDMEKVPTEETIGTVISHKTTEYGDVVAVVVRGGGYGLEWANTFDIGSAGDARGLSDASRKVTKRIKEYEKKYDLSGAKIFITGYSRGGAVADLAGKYINEHLSEFGIGADDLYAYTFEAPAASCTENRFENIHNVVNVNDPIPLFFSENWGLYRCGVREPLAVEDVKVNYKQLELSLTGISIVNKYTSSFDMNIMRQNDLYDPPVSLSAAEKRIVDWMTRTVSREEFDAHSEGVRKLLALVYSFDPYERTAMINFIKDTFSEITFGNIKKMYDLISVFGSKASDDEAGKKLFAIISAALDKKDHIGVIDEEKYRQFKSALPDISFIVASLLRADYKETKTFEYTCTLYEHIAAMVSQHFTEKELALCEIEDSYYYPISLASAEIAVNEATADVVSVKVNNVILNAGTDYAVSYRDSAGKIVEPSVSGEYTAVVSGVGSYSDTAEKTFVAVFPHYHKWVFEKRGHQVAVKCTEKECDYSTGKEYVVELITENKTYDGEPSKAHVKKSEGFPKEIAVGIIGYRSGESGSVSTAPEMPGKYTATVDVYVIANGKEHALAECDFTIEAIRLDSKNTVIETKENSAEVISVMFGEKLLEEGKDYSLRYFDKDGKEITKPENAGTYTVSAVGENTYSGECSKEITIKNFVLLIVIFAGLAVVIITFSIIFLSKKASRKDKTEK